MARGSRSHTNCLKFGLATLLLAAAGPNSSFAQTGWHAQNQQYAYYAPRGWNNGAHYPVSPLPRMSPYVQTPYSPAWQAQPPHAMAVPVGPLAPYGSGKSIVTAPPQPHPQPNATSAKIQQVRFRDFDLPPPPATPRYQPGALPVPIPAAPPYGLEYYEDPEEHAGKRWTHWQWLTSSFHDPWPRESSDPCLYVHAAALLYRMRPLEVSEPLVTTGDSADIPPGALGRSTTQVLLGAEDWDFGTFTGGRVRVGKWFRNGDFGIEAAGFMLEEQSIGSRFASDSAGNPVLAFPTFRSELGREGVFQISDPATALTGAVDISASSQLWGWEGNGMLKLMRTPNADCDLLIGGRYVRLDENLRFVGDLFDPTLQANDDFVDDFDTENQFFGGSVGGRFACYWGPFIFDVRGSVAVGTTYQTVRISGATVQSSPLLAGAAEFPGGVFALPTNIGIKSRHRFTVIPEVQTKVSLVVTPSLRIYGGYDFIYWSEIVRPADQIDRSINQTQRAGGLLVGPARPEHVMRDTYFWAHGMRWGFELLF